MAELHHECGVAAVYQFSGELSDKLPNADATAAAGLTPRVLLDIQNRGQLAAGMTSFNPLRNQLLDTHKDVGGVSEVFRLAHKEDAQRLMAEYAGVAAIGHVRYATCGKDDRSYAQPFERHHLEMRKWFAFAFNGQLANYRELRENLLSKGGFHLARETDTEILMHLLSQEISRQSAGTADEGFRIDYRQLLGNVCSQLDGAYNIVFLNALGDLVVARDPLGIRPMCYANDGRLFAAASESVALANLGFGSEMIRSLEPGCALVIQDGKMEKIRFAESPRRAHCFFEWIYFANVASSLDERSVYLARKSLGEKLAEQETVEIDEDTVVVPVPDTAKAAADAMAYKLQVPSLEGLIRNRYVGRTFIESGDRMAKAKLKYTPLREVLEGKKVFVVEDTIVRSTTMRALVSQLRERGGAQEVHVRVACPPITGPCFYGIDMSGVSELFAPKFLGGGPLTPAVEADMADDIGADSLRYLPVEAISEALELSADALCQACIDGTYPTPAGEKLYQLALKADEKSADNVATGRLLDVPVMAART